VRGSNSPGGLGLFICAPRTPCDGKQLEGSSPALRGHGALVRLMPWWLSCSDRSMTMEAPHGQAETKDDMRVTWTLQGWTINAGQHPTPGPFARDHQAHADNTRAREQLSCWLRGCALRSPDLRSWAFSRNPRSPILPSISSYLFRAPPKLSHPLSLTYNQSRSYWDRHPSSPFGFFVKNSKVTRYPLDEGSRPRQAGTP
jgi:hypothetical protein